MRASWWAAALALLGLTATGCVEGGCQGSESTGAEQAGATEAPAEPSLRTGTVRGVVRLAEGASLPRYSAEEMGRIVGAPHVPGCAPALPEDGDNVKLSEQGRGLTGVMVTATGTPEAFFAQVPEHQPVERSLLLDRCRLTPSLVVAMRGDSLVIKNQGAQPLFPVFGQAAYADSLVQGETRTIPLERGGITAVTCAVAPDCGRADVVVVMNPVFTLSEEAGSFTLEGVPADQEVVIHAWHPLFVEARATTRVTAGGEASVELLLEPRPAP